MKIIEAIEFATGNLLRNAPALGSPGKPYPIVIDPLIDGQSGMRTQATEAMGTLVSNLIRTQYPGFSTVPFNKGNLEQKPLLFIGTLTAVDAKGGNAGPREWYRICLALVDLKSGRIVAKGFGRAATEGVNHAPTPFFEQQPAWAPDAATQGYVRTCQGTAAGDEIKPEYLATLFNSARIHEAIGAYEKGRYKEALDLYQAVRDSGGGTQLRVLNGIYLAQWHLGRSREAARAFGDILDHGLAQRRLAVRFLFRPGSTAFVADRKLSAAYPTWLAELSRRVQREDICLEISGHTSRSGPEPLNQKLSLQRAEAIRARLGTGARNAPLRLSVAGKGSSEALSGLGTDDARDVIDRRVEFKPVDCTSRAAST